MENFIFCAVILTNFENFIPDTYKRGLIEALEVLDYALIMRILLGN